MSELPLIWVVDDSRTEMALTLQALGTRYRYETFGDGSSVIERLAMQGPRPNLILLDWVMPGMSGDEVTRFLRAQPHTNDLPIIIVTASRVETGDVVQGLSLGANDYVARPFAPAELRARVDSALRAREAALLAEREQRRLGTISKLGRALFEAATDIPLILETLLRTLTEYICDGSSILLLPGDLPQMFMSLHRGEVRGEALSEIATVADPSIHAFASSEEARERLPPAYHPYIDRFGLRGLAIFPFPILAPVQGVVTATRDGSSDPFDEHDLSLIETCIEYASLAVQNAVRYETERIARDQLDTVLAQLPVGIIVADESRRIRLSNETARATVPGLATAQTLGDVWRLAEWRTPDGGALGEQVWNTEPEIVMQRGNVMKTLTASTVPLQKGRGETAGSITVLHDVSSEREATREREQFARFMQRLLGIVGHDLRNPLGAFVAGIDMLDMRAGTNPQIQPILVRLHSSTRRMTRIVDQLLDVTRATLGSGIPIELRDAELVSLVRNVVEETSLVHPDAKFEVSATVDIEGKWDPDRLGQVVSNLVSNAAHYGRPGAPVAIEVATKDDHAVIAVHNQLRDRPIPAETLGVLFDPHRRGNDARHNQAGLGLGLYIVHQIVRAHRGQITAQSDETGTVFRVVLPRKS